MTITLGWWCLPLAITIATYVGFGMAGWFTSRNSGYGFGGDIGPAIALIGWLVISLFVWLVWAVLT